MSWSRRSTSGDVPEERRCAAASCVGNIVYLHGGTQYAKAFDDLYTLDTGSWAWSKPTTSGQQPPRLWGHSCDAVGTQLFIFGGETVGGTSHKLFCLDTTTMTWSEPSTSGKAPSARAYHASAVIGSEIYVFGGESGEALFNDIHVYSTETGIWRELQPTGITPEPVRRHTLVAYKSRLFIFGGFGPGCGSLTGAYFNDLDILDLDSNEWQRAERRGAVPPARGSHCAAVINDRMFVFGGGGTESSPYNDLHYFSFEDFTWMERPAMFRVPKERWGMAYATVNSQLIIIGGNFDAKTSTNEVWSLDVSRIY